MTNQPGKGNYNPNLAWFDSNHKSGSVCVCIDRFCNWITLNRISRETLQRNAGVTTDRETGVSRGHRGQINFFFAIFLLNHEKCMNGITDKKCLGAPQFSPSPREVLACRTVEMCFFPFRP